MIARPFQELELPDEHRPQPAAIRHLGFDQPGAPSATLGLWQIGERTLTDRQCLEAPHQLRPQGGRDPFRVRVA